MNLDVEGIIRREIWEPEDEVKALKDKVADLMKRLQEEEEEATRIKGRIERLEKRLQQEME